MKKYPVTVIVALSFLSMHTLFWAGFAGLVISGAHPGLPDSRDYQWLLAGLALACAAGLLTLILLLVRRFRPAYYLTMAALSFFAVLTFADDVGLADWIYLILVLIPLILLVRDRPWYLSKKEAALA
jgi:hypothetical protein